MVPLENKSELQNIVKKDEELEAFFGYVINSNSKSSELEKSLSSSSQIVLTSLDALSRDFMPQFNSALIALSSREPSKNSPWIYNDILIFVMLLGCKKFKLDCSHIEKLIALRKKSGLPEKNRITGAFANIASSHFDYTDELGFLYWVFEYNLFEKIPTELELKEIYSNLALNWVSVKENIFLRILATKAYDLFVCYFPFDSTKIKKMENFERRFLKRVKIYAKILYYLFLIIILLASIFFTLEYISHPEAQSKAKDYFSIFKNIGGYGGVLSILIARNKITNFFYSSICKIWGYHS